jgi:small-conductance mechanosensitive channel
LHILLSRQIKAGDYIKLSTGEEGNVVDISWRNTIIRALGNNMIIVPNQKIASTIITNYHLLDTELSISVSASVSYDSDLDNVERITVEVATEVMKEFMGGIEDFEPSVRFHTFGDSSINFSVALRVKEFVDQYRVKHEFIKRLHQRYQQEGIEFPFPARNVYTKTSSIGH